MRSNDTGFLIFLFYHITIAKRPCDYKALLAEKFGQFFRYESGRTLNPLSLSLVISGKTVKPKRLLMLLSYTKVCAIVILKNHVAICS